MPPLRPRRIAALATGLALAGAVLAGCSSEGASTQCGLDQCTVTFDRGVEASIELPLLGIDAKLVGVDGEVVTVEVAGQQLSLTTEQQAAEVAGLQVTLESVTDSEIAVKISR